MLARLQRAFDLLSHAFRDKRTLPSDSSFADRAIGNLAIFFLLLWLGLRALRRRLGRLLR
jgi:hypothetical protein